MRLLFETSAAHYTCSIPTCGASGKYHTKPFTRYCPTQTAGFTPEFDLDDLTPDPTAEEMVRVKANIERLRNARQR